MGSRVYTFTVSSSLIFVGMHNVFGPVVALRHFKISVTSHMQISFCRSSSFLLFCCCCTSLLCYVSLKELSPQVADQVPEISSLLMNDDWRRSLSESFSSVADKICILTHSISSQPELRSIFLKKISIWYAMLPLRVIWFQSKSSPTVEIVSAHFLFGSK